MTMKNKPITNPKEIEKIAEFIYKKYWGIVKGIPVDVEEIIKSNFSDKIILSINDDLKTFYEIKKESNDQKFKIEFKKKNLSFETINVNLAMELGEIVLNLTEFNDQKIKNELLGLFVVTLLIPTNVLLDAIHHGWNSIFELAQFFKVDEELLKAKLVWIGIFPVYLI